MTNSPNKNHENCIADSKENYLLDLGSEKAKEPISESWVTMKFKWAPLEMYRELYGE